MIFSTTITSTVVKQKTFLVALTTRLACYIVYGYVAEWIQKRYDVTII